MGERVTVGEVGEEKGEEEGEEEGVEDGEAEEGATVVGGVGAGEGMLVGTDVEV